MSEMNMKRLIINADDCGYTRGINQGIIEGHKRGIITSCSLMVGADYFDDAVERLKNAEGLSVGIHLTLSNVKSTLSANQVPLLVNKNGYFPKTPVTLIQRFIMFPVSLQQVKAELSNQCYKMISAGINPSHIDTHKHFHLYMPLFEIVVQIALEFNIRAIRIPYDSINIKMTKPKRRFSKFILQTIKVLQKRMKKILKNNNIKFTDHFFGFQYTGHLNEEVLINLIRSLPKGTTELMCHPGFYTKELKTSQTRLKESRKAEFDALTSKNVLEEIRRNNIELINYNQL
jgi:hopanoid biosynthesis associated protein HpnK